MTTNDPATPPAAPQPPPTVPPVPQRKLDPRVAWTVFGGAGAVMLGALLPWAKVQAGIFSAEKAGTDGDGVITLLLALGVGVVAILLVTQGVQLWKPIVIVAAGGLCVLTAIVDMVDVKNRAADPPEGLEGIQVTIGIGLWLTLLGAVAIVVGGVLTLTTRNR